MRIYKYKLEKPKTLLELPIGSWFLSCGQQEGVPVVWAMVDTECDVLMKHIIEIHPTGFTEIDTGPRLDFIGTIQMPDGLVWHIFCRHPE